MLADAPGVGKSAQVVRACEYVGAKAITGLVPNRTLAVNMAREFRRWHWWGMPVHIVASRKDKLPQQGLVLTTYALAATDAMKRKLADRPCDVLFCDEAHALKELTSKRTRAVITNQISVARAAKRVWLMTGTPAPNHAGELFVFAKASGVWPGTYGDWLNNFCVTTEDLYGVKIVGSKNHERLRELLAPVYLRRTAVEGRAPLQITDMLVTAASDPYEGISAEDRASIEAAIAAGDMSFADTPAVASVRRRVGLAKAPGIAELAVADLEGGYKKLLIFCQHTDVIDAVAAKLGKYGVGIYDGRTSEKRRVQLYDDFQTTDNLRVLILQNQAGGEGLTWTAANRVLLGEPSWVPKDNEQAIARAWRRGQTQNVHASYLSLAGSLDEQISKTLKRKAADIAQIV